MTQQAPLLTRHDLEAKIVKRCWEDEGFRNEFTADPAGAFVRYLDVPAASLPRIVVHEETPGSWHIVLPPRPANTKELSEQDLEKVAGGFTPTLVVVSITAASIGASISTSISASAMVSVDRGW
jgi:hypothetical protein